MSTNSKKEKTPRPPVVVVMGHVDHGKTTLLDYLRSTKIAEKEAGGITQSIGAYEIVYKSKNNQEEEKKITFIDTPGHEAFTKMRERGAKVADVAILIVSADDGVKPQTEEVIKILKETKTPHVVAINKIDKNNADVERTKQDLISHGVELEGFGGDVPLALISAKTGEGINDLLDLVLLVAEMNEITWDSDAPASGFMIESHKDKNRGVDVSIVIKNGILSVGDNIYTISSEGVVKFIENFYGESVDKIEPSSPARILGFKSLPHVGEIFSNEKDEVIKITEKNINEYDVIKHKTEHKEEGGNDKHKQIINIILRADTSGSVEALETIIKSLKFDDFKINVVSSSVGNITDGVVKNAIATNSWVVGFNIKSEKNAENLAKSSKIKIIISDIIYKIVESIENQVKDVGQEIQSGKLKVLATFSRQGEKQVIGGEAVFGSLQEGDRFNVIRNEEIAGSGNILNIQQDKKDLKRVNGGECGLKVRSKEEIKKDDILEVIV